MARSNKAYRWPAERRALVAPVNAVIDAMLAEIGDGEVHPDVVKENVVAQIDVRLDAQGDDLYAKHLSRSFKKFVSDRLKARLPRRILVDGLDAYIWVPQEKRSNPYQLLAPGFYRRLGACSAAEVERVIVQASGPLAGWTTKIDFLRAHLETLKKPVRKTSRKTAVAA